MITNSIRSYIFFFLFFFFFPDVAFFYQQFTQTNFQSMMSNSQSTTNAPLLLCTLKALLAYFNVILLNLYKKKLNSIFSGKKKFELSLSWHKITWLQFSLNSLQIITITKWKITKIIPEINFIQAWKSQIIIPLTTIFSQTFQKLTFSLTKSNSHYKKILVE